MDEPAGRRRDASGRARPRPVRGDRPPRWAALPPAARDRAGRALSLGDVVRVGEGDHAGELAEVVGWGGRRGVELVVHGRPPAFFTVPPEVVERVGVRLVDPLVPRDHPPPG